ncbi:MAG: hypothetical protein J0H98_05235 [Solirubrobacterales bacterium]|nr:hypothetical protein [Solirubrobacterales bacterium]
MSGGGGAIGALFFVIGVLIVFALLFSTFLVIPFFVFLAGIIAMLISDRNRGSGKKEEAVEVVETTEVREGK